MQHYKNDEHFEGKDLLKIQYDTHNADREHTHDFVELVYVTKGEVIHRVNNEFYKIRRGGLVFINIGQVHSFFSHGNVEFVNITLKSDFFQESGIDDFFEYIKASAAVSAARWHKGVMPFDKENISCVYAADSNDMLSIHAKMYIDTTGTSALAYKAGAQTMRGNPLWNTYNPYV